MGYSKEQVPYPLANNPHIKIINYSANDIHKYVGFYGQQSSIVFDHNEVINTLSMGVSTGWQLDPQGNRLFIKPISENADTNATIITNKRTYYFKFYAKDPGPDGMENPEVAYEVRFRYPSNSIIINNNIVNNNSLINEDDDIPDVSTAENLNFDYLVQGSDYIKPIKAFDDGKFTYLEFDHKNADLPAIFLVDSQGYESLINFRVRGNYIIIERVAARFTLRHGLDTVCLINNKIPYHYKSEKKKIYFFHSRKIA